MNAINATWTNGRIIPAGPVDWPEGSELLVEPLTPTEKIGLDETEWRDSAETLADWEAWICTVQPLEYTDEERASLARYQESFRRHNLDAVRKQMGLGERA